VSSIITSTGKLHIGVVPDLTNIGYTRENPPTAHVVETRQRLAHLTSRVGTLEASGGGGALASRVAALESLVERLVARLAYAEGYLKLIDEAVFVEGFAGWQPPE